METRKVLSENIVRGHAAIDGAGVRLQRVLGLRTVHTFDPFLMLDGFDSTNPSDYMKGFPWHPHRGIETITYLVSGEMEHGDNLGNKGVIGNGAAQWMSAGSGIIHQEMPRESERMLGLQLWVNLPKEDKMSTPTYRDIKPEDIVVVDEESTRVRILSGEYHGHKGGSKGDHVQVTYLDVELGPDQEFVYDEATNDLTVASYLLEGTLAVEGDLSSYEKKGCAVLYSPSDEDPEKREAVRVKAGPEGARFVLLTGKPLKEPVAWGGPIVMNTREELDLAFEELNNGTFIKEEAE